MALLDAELKHRLAAATSAVHKRMLIVAVPIAVSEVLLFFYSAIIRDCFNKRLSIDLCSFIIPIFNKHLQHFQQVKIQTMQTYFNVAVVKTYSIDSLLQE